MLTVTITVEDLIEAGVCKGGLAQYLLDYPDGLSADWTVANQVKAVTHADYGWLNAKRLLPSIDLRGADLRKVDLRGAHLYQADLRKADLRGADLRDADLRGADLRWADLRDADLRDVDLYGVNLRDADLRGSRRDGLIIDGAGTFEASLLAKGAIL